MGGFLPLNSDSYPMLSLLWSEKFCPTAACPGSLRIHVFLPLIHHLKGSLQDLPSREVFDCVVFGNVLCEVPDQEVRVDQWSWMEWMGWSSDPRRPSHQVIHFHSNYPKNIPKNYSMCCEVHSLELTWPLKIGLAKRKVSQTTIFHGLCYS